MKNKLLFLLVFILLFPFLLGLLVIKGKSTPLSVQMYDRTTVPPGGPLVGAVVNCRIKRLDNGQFLTITNIWTVTQTDRAMTEVGTTEPGMYRTNIIIDTAALNISAYCFDASGNGYVATRDIKSCNRFSDC